MLAVEIIGKSFLWLQVCCNKGFTDAQIIAGTEALEPCGTTKGWTVRQGNEQWVIEGNDRNNVPKEVRVKRRQCAENLEREHLILDA